MDLVLVLLKVTYHPVYGMNNFVTNKSKLPQDIWGDWLSCDPHMGHMIALTWVT